MVQPIPGEYMMDELKRCSGHKGHWECGTDYPDHLLPASEFGLNVRDGLQSLCKRCMAAHNNFHNPASNAISAAAYKKAGTSTKFYALPKDERLALRAEAKLDAGYDDFIASNQHSLRPSAPPRFDDGRPESTRKKSKRMPKGATREGMGYVYIYQDERIPEDLKVGAEKLSHDRLRHAGTWGFYKCLFNLKFDERFKAEREVHKILAAKRIVSNKEIFKCSVIEAQVAIETVALRNSVKHTVEV
jgi:hypothetical protein